MCSRPSFLPPLLHINNCSCCKPWFSLWEGSCTRWPEQLALSNGSTLYGFLFQKTHILKDSCIFFHVVDVYWSVESRNSYSTVMLMSMWACGCSQRLCRVYQLKWQVTTTLGEASNSKCCFPADSLRLCWAMVEEAGAERWAALDSSANRVVRAGRKSIWRITAGWGEVGGKSWGCWVWSLRAVRAVQLSTVQQLALVLDRRADLWVPFCSIFGDFFTLH